MTADVTGMFAPSVGAGLHQLAEDCDVDLLVVGATRRGAVGRLLRGDDTRASLAGAACAVAVAPHAYGERPRQITTIGVGYDGSIESEAALTAARSLAARHPIALPALTAVGTTAAGTMVPGHFAGGRAPAGATVRPLTVVRPAPSGRWSPAIGRGMDTAIERLTQAARPRLSSLAGVDGVVRVGLSAAELAAFADEVDLLVVGSRGHGRLRRSIIGSTSRSSRAGRAARCSFSRTASPRTWHAVPNRALAESRRGNRTRGSKVAFSGPFWTASHAPVGDSVQTRSAALQGRLDGR
jgi:nucleotide-binding universal stress UspA family protein